MRERLNPNVVFVHQKREVVALNDGCVEEAEMRCENRTNLTKTRVAMYYNS